MQQIAPMAPEKILEIGCGTGLLTEELRIAFPDADLTITDPAANMLRQARQKLGKTKGTTGGTMEFRQLNAETDPIDGPYDLIIANMVIHWFEDVEGSLNKICRASGHPGRFYFSTIGKDCFPEWQRALSKNDLPLGLRIPAPLYGVTLEEHIKVNYDDPIAFLKTLQKTGAAQPRQNYRPLSPGALKKAMASLGREKPTPLTWHILYGQL